MSQEISEKENPAPSPPGETKPAKEIWSSLKSKPKDKLELELPRADHEKILRLLRRQSAKDLAFRFQCVEQEKSFDIGYYSIGDKLYIYFKWKDKVTQNFVIGPDRIGKKR